MTKRNRPQSPVTQERAERLRPLAGTMTDWEIAAIMQIPVSTLHYVARQNGISLRFIKKEWTTERCDLLKTLVAEGKTSGQCAEALGVSRPAIDIQLAKMRKRGDDVADRLANWGGYRNGYRWEPDKDQLLMRLWPTHKLREIAELIGVSIDAVKCRVVTLRKHGFSLVQKTGGRARKVK